MNDKQKELFYSFPIYGMTAEDLSYSNDNIKDVKDMNLVQLVSFGCGCDAITTDECRSMLESNNKIYTQIKIDEISNLGACKIRVRSLLEAINEGK